MSDPFATATELCEWIGLAVPSDLARLQSILGSASAVIRSHCDQRLSEVTDDVVVLRASERTTLILPERPVTSILTVVANGVTLSPTTGYNFTLHSGTIAAEGTPWTYGATVTYSHGYAETTDGFEAIKTICMEAASRAYTLNERSASEAMGSTLMESAGYAPEIFLTQGEKWKLADFGKVGVG